MEFRTGEEAAEPGSRAEGSKGDSEKLCFGCGSEAEEPECTPTQPKSGAVAPKPSDVRNGDLVSLLLAATPPYLYNIPLVPQTFFFSEMLKSFVQAKAERQNLKAQTHHRRQRKRHWREATPPRPEPRDKPLELTTPRQGEEKPRPEKSPPKKPQPEGGEKKLSELGNFSVENLANSSITETDSSPVSASPPGDRLPPGPPPLWYPLLYPPHPPYGIDPLHFFIDLRVSAHFWDRTATPNLGNGFDSAAGEPPESPLVGRGRHASAFRVPSPRKEDAPPAKEPRERSRNVHYVISSLKDIYRSLERGVRGKREKEGEGEGEGEEKKWEKGKDLRALIGLELVVDYVKQESDGEEEEEEENKPEITPPDQGGGFRSLCLEQ